MKQAGPATIACAVKPAIFENRIGPYTRCKFAPANRSSPTRLPFRFDNRSITLVSSKCRGSVTRVVAIPSLNPVKPQSMQFQGLARGTTQLR